MTKSTPERRKVLDALDGRAHSTSMDIATTLAAAATATGYTDMEIALDTEGMWAVRAFATRGVQRRMVVSGFGETPEEAAADMTERAGVFAVRTSTPEKGAK